MKEILKNYGQNNETYMEHNLEEYVLYKRINNQYFLSNPLNSLVE